MSTSAVCTDYPLSGSALVIAHPGHELRVHGWMARRRAHVFVLTDGSGRTGRSRLQSTTAVLAAVGARRGSVYGRYSDAEVYRALLARDTATFVALAEEIAAAFTRLSIVEVAGDALEGYNPAHDLCRYVVDAAVAIARAGCRSIASYDFPLVGPPDADANGRSGVVRICLGGDEVESKEQAARRYQELAGEVDEALRVFGRDAFRVECLRPVRESRTAPPDDPPEYERYGEERVAAGRYGRVLRFRQHILPIAEALAGASAPESHCGS